MGNVIGGMATKRFIVQSTADMGTKGFSRRRSIGRLRTQLSINLQTKEEDVTVSTFLFSAIQ